jgi:hypothetical protein
MKSIRYFYLFSCLFLTALSSCDKDPEVPNEEELITTLIYTLTPSGGGAPVVFSFQDLDGDGGQNPVVVSGNLTANTIYNGVIQLLNESVSPVEDITTEVGEEAEEHQFFYIFSDVPITREYTDEDVDNNPIGITTTITTDDPGEGLMTIVLRHLPDKLAVGVSDGDITNAGGETDIEVSFMLTIE